MSPDPVADARAAVASVSRRLADAGLVLGTSGNVSVAIDDGLIAVSPTGARLRELDAAAVAVVDRDGTLVDGPLEPTSELALHLGAYAQPDVGAVVHAHAPYSTAIGCALAELPIIHYDMHALGGAVRVAPYATFGTQALADGVLAALDGRRAALMANHGALTIGVDAETALRATELLEWCCALYVRAAQLGTPRTLSAEQLDEVVETIAGRGYGAARQSVR